MWKAVKDREAGFLLPSSFATRIRSHRVASLDLSNHKEIVSPHNGAVNSLQVDLTEERYLLSGSSDGSAAVYDIQHATDYESGLIAKHKSLFVVDKQHNHGHRYAISTAIWYPVDTGLFITGSFDHYIKVWDTNTTQVVMDFKMPGKVYRTAMSSIATTHMLIAGGSTDVQVRLCDIASGAFTHTLSGHRDGVMSLEWSTSSEWILVTGGCDGAIRFWDIRRAGCFRVLDQSRSQLGRRPLAESTSKKGSVTGQSSSVKSMVSQRRIPLGNEMKQLRALRKSQHLPRGPVVQRLHPGLSSTHNRAVAHYGAVTGLRATGDGMYLLSSGTRILKFLSIFSKIAFHVPVAGFLPSLDFKKEFSLTLGSDSRLRLWDVDSGYNTLVNFEAMRLQPAKALQLAVSQDSSLVFVPCLATVKAYDVRSGMTFRTFRGHYELVNCCCLSSQDQELYTGSNDRQILVWSPASPVIAEVEEGKGGWVSVADQDNWSD